MRDDAALHVLIGAGSGMGAAVARRLASTGETVAALAAQVTARFRGMSGSSPKAVSRSRRRGRALVAFACSPAASFLTGCDLRVHGGVVAALTHRSEA